MHAESQALGMGKGLFEHRISAHRMVEDLRPGPPQSDQAIPPILIGRNNEIRLIERIDRGLKNAA